MNEKYPVWWNTTITIYNRFENPQTSLVTWYKHVIKDCFWKDISDKILVGNTVLETNNIICRIPKQNNFLEKYAWTSQSSATIGNYFTLGVGDIIVRGEVSDTINEYQSGSRSTDILNKYKKLQGCMQIEIQSINIGPGKLNEHYFVKGV